MCGTRRWCFTWRDKVILWISSFWKLFETFHFSVWGFSFFESSRHEFDFCECMCLDPTAAIGDTFSGFILCFFQNNWGCISNYSRGQMQKWEMLYVRGPNVVLMNRWCWNAAGERWRQYSTKWIQWVIPFLQQFALWVRMVPMICW